MAKKQEAFELFNKGFTPVSPEVKALKLAESSRYVYYHEWQDKKESPPTQNLPGKKERISLLAKAELHTIIFPLTPIMITAKEAAVREWGWEREMPFEDFLDTVLYHLFKDRGIILQGYIVEEIKG